MAEEKLKIYVVTLEDVHEPGYSRHRDFVVAQSAGEAEAIKRGESDRNIILASEEFSLPGYKIHVMKE